MATVRQAEVQSLVLQSLKGAIEIGRDDAAEHLLCALETLAEDRRDDRWLRTAYRILADEGLPPPPAGRC
jgi:hypothetical protein